MSKMDYLEESVTIAVAAGTEIDSYCNVPVYENGLMFHRGHGKHYSDDGYYYGQKWQCVEYIKRFYKIVLNHQMPDGMGHAWAFFDDRLGQGELNKKRGLLQFYNGQKAKPVLNDILVFQDTQYGHVGVVSAITEYSVEIVQQNIYGQPRQQFSLTNNSNGWSIESPRIAAGWLRMP